MTYTNKHAILARPIAFAEAAGYAVTAAGTENRATHVGLGQGGVPAWAARAAALARGAWGPGRFQRGRSPPLPLELRGLCEGARHISALSF